MKQKEEDGSINLMDPKKTSLKICTTAALPNDFSLIWIGVKEKQDYLNMIC